VRLRPRVWLRLTKTSRPALSVSSLPASEDARLSTSVLVDELDPPGRRHGASEGRLVCSKKDWVRFAKTAHRRPPLVLWQAFEGVYRVRPGSHEPVAQASTKPDGVALRQPSMYIQCIYLKGDCYAR
jgi:hypothetical protein